MTTASYAAYLWSFLPYAEAAEWGVAALTSSGPARDLWLEEQAYRRAALVACNAPTSFVGLWLAASFARRSALALLSASRAARAAVGVGVRDSAGGGGECPAGARAPAAPASALRTLGALVRASPRPGLAVHVVGYAVALGYAGMAAWLWQKRAPRGGGAAAADLAAALAPPAAAFLGVVASEMAADAEAGAGLFARVEGRLAADAPRHAAAACISFVASGLWSFGASGALDALETRLADAVAAAVAAAKKTIAYALPQWGAQLTAGSSAWSAGPLCAGAAGAGLFSASFLMSKVGPPAAAPPRAPSAAAAAAAAEAAADAPPAPPAPPRAHAEPREGERMYAFLARVLDA